MQREPRFILFYEPPRPLHPLPLPPDSPFLPLLPYPVIHSLLLPPFRISPTISFETTPRSTSLPFIDSPVLWVRRARLAHTVCPSQRFLGPCVSNAIGFPEFLASVEFFPIAKGRCGYLVLAGHTGWGIGYEGGRESISQNVGSDQRGV